jgi:hypothetical protein
MTAARTARQTQQMLVGLVCITLVRLYACLAAWCGPTLMLQTRAMMLLAKAVQT